jgi:hypothetical protein
VAMDKQDIRTLLDSLDVQVSMGRIDQPTYDALREKWVQQLQEIEGSEESTVLGVALERAGVAATDTEGLTSSTRELLARSSLSQAEEPARYTIKVLACPRCNAPAEIKAGGDLSQPLKCPFCETVYTVRQSQDNEQQLKKDLKAWLDQIIVSSGYSSGVSGVDINARRFIFRESLYPALKKEIDRRLETFENMLEAPLVQMKETRDFRDYRPDLRLTMLAKGDNQWLKTLSTRVSAQQLQDFAVAQEDKQRLRQLQVRVLSLTYYANIAQHASSSGAYRLVRKNIVALQKEYQAYLREIADEHYRSYILVLDARTTADILLLDLFISALEEGQHIVPQALLFQVGNVIAQLEKAQSLALACTYNPLYTVPLQQGIQKDMTTARIFQAVVVDYEVATRTRAEEFRPFYERLMRYARHLANIESAEHLLWLLTSIGRVLLARAAEAPLPVVKDWTWLDAAVEAQRRKAPGQVVLHYHPYWIAQMNYTEVGGMLVKRASAREGFLLADASSVGAPIIVAVRANDAAFPMMEAGLQNFQLLDQQIVSLPAVLPYEKAEQAIRAYAYAHEAELRVLATRMLGILYLPAASIRYIDKNGKRDVVVSCVRNINQDLVQALKQTQDFLAQG